jgi:hypothetical protein
MTYYVELHLSKCATMNFTGLKIQAGSMKRTHRSQVGSSSFHHVWTIIHLVKYELIQSPAPTQSGSVYINYQSRIPSHHDFVNSFAIESRPSARFSIPSSSFVKNPSPYPSLIFLRTTTHYCAAHTASPSQNSDSSSSHDPAAMDSPVAIPDRMRPGVLGSG